MRFLFVTIFIILTLESTAQKKTLLFSDDFSKPLDTAFWHIEMEPFPNSKVETKNGKLVLDTKGGVTVWFKKQLSGKIRIEYTRKIIVSNGLNDRLSDMNQFWMATDPLKQNLFTRKGKFEEYDSLSLYYAGIGGNTNTTTRFREYLGNGQKPLFIDCGKKADLLQANKEYKIVIIVDGSKSSFSVNGKNYHIFDPTPLTKGYFGFRSTWSRQEIDQFRVYMMH